MEELGECYRALNKPGAGKYFAKAHELLSRNKWLVENEPERIVRLKDLGKVKTSLSD